MPDVAESALAELSAAATAYLRDPAGLVRLVKARDRADAFLGKRHTRQCTAALRLDSTPGTADRSPMKQKEVPDG